MKRYQPFFEYYNGEDTIKSDDKLKKDPFIDKINKAINLVSSRYESLDYMRTVKGRSVSLSTYLPSLQIPIDEEFKAFDDYAKDGQTGDTETYAGFFVPSIDKLNETINAVEKSETAIFNPPIIFELFEIMDGKFVDNPRRAEKFGEDSFYVGKKVDQKFSKEEIESWFKEKAV